MCFRIKNSNRFIVLSKALEESAVHKLFLCPVQLPRRRDIIIIHYGISGSVAHVMMISVSMNNRPSCPHRQLFLIDHIIYTAAARSKIPRSSNNTVAVVGMHISVHVLIIKLNHCFAVCNAMPHILHQGVRNKNRYNFIIHILIYRKRYINLCKHRQIIVLLFSKETLSILYLFHDLSSLRTRLPKEAFIVYTQYPSNNKTHLSMFIFLSDSQLVKLSIVKTLIEEDLPLANFD